MFHKHKYPVAYTYQILIVILSLALAGCSARTTAEPTPSPETATPVPPTNTTEPTATTEPTPTPPTPTIEPSPTSPPPMPECPDGVVMFRSNVQTTYMPLNHYFSICPDGTGLVPVVSNELLWENTLSPDGDRFARTEYLDRKLVIEDITTHEETTVLVLQYEIQQLAWSPDGAYVAYTVLDKQSGGEWFWRVEIVHLSTQTLSTNFFPGELPGISIDELPPQTFERLSWSPNGTYLLMFGAGGSQIVTVNCSAANVCAAELHSTSARSMSAAGYDSLPWSPDGGHIAYACMTAYETESDVPSHPNIEFEYGLCVQDVDGNLIQEFKAETLGVEDIRSLTWSPDGTSIAFTAKEIGHSDDDIFVLNLDDEALINLTEKMDGYQEEPIWIP